MRGLRELAAVLRRLGKRLFHLLLEGEQLLHARAALDALEMRRAVRESGDVDAELGGAAQHQKKCASGAVKWSKKYSRPASKSSAIL